MANGNFIISLDFELHWGGAEKWNLEKKSAYFLNTRHFIPELLIIFNENNIKCTWATVGFLFAENKNQLLGRAPKLLPTYKKEELSYYKIFPTLGDNENEDPFHYAPKLIQQILNTPGQELGSHTFAHYYCNEAGQTVEQFNADMKAAQRIANENYRVVLKSLVFPRNQFNKEYLQIAKKNGIKIVRSNPKVWFWERNFGIFTPLFRAIDTLLPISKSLCFDKPIEQEGVICLPASRFFRPYKVKEEIIQGMKLRRIKREMSYAAKNNKNYHLWWHPHNFGDHIDSNREQLLDILAHFNVLKKQYNFTSASMVDFLKD